MLQKKPHTLGYSSDSVDAPSHVNNQALLAYWEEKRAKGQPLMRSDFDPLQLPKLLPCLFLAKPLGDDYQFRLVGSQIEERMRRALTNQTLTGVYGADFGPKTVENYRRAATTCEPLTLRGNYVGDNLEHIDFEVLHLAIQFEDGSRGVIGGQFAFD